MYVVALLAQKGGVGKTTLAVTLAVQACLAGESAGLIDGDPQATASGWALARAKTQGKTAHDVVPPVAAAHDKATLERAIRDARADGLQWLFIDTQPGVAELPATAAEEADLVLMPCAPSTFNVDALQSTALLVAPMNKPRFFIINKGRSKGINDEYALALTTAYGLPAVNTHITLRQSIADGEFTGTSIVEFAAKDPSILRGKQEVRALWHWLKKQRAKA